MKTKLVIFGITGDLSTRKLLPALAEIISTGDYDDLEVIGVSRHAVDVSELLQKSLGNDALKDRVRVVSIDLAESAEYQKLCRDVDLQQDEQALVYLAVPPSASINIVNFLGEVGFNTPNVKLLSEKPFGFDLASAREFLEREDHFFDEKQIYRIDHYLAKEMARNIVVFRGRNALFSRIWNNGSIEKIEIMALEKIGIENRTTFYEQTGALRDIVQGHLMQLLALTILDIPVELNWDDLPDLRQAAVDQLEPADPTKAVRAQYASYQKEVDNPGSSTETFVSVELASRDSRWEGVPFHLITGKALDQKVTEVRVYLRKDHAVQSNCIIFRIQPDEGISIQLVAKKPGYERDFETKELRFDYASDTRLPSAYEQVIVDAIRSQKSLFACGGEVLRSWEILQPLQQAWGRDSSPLKTYPDGATVEEVLKQ
jgi:glucose-6-phosphate 1-dehydrogenase